PCCSTCATSTGPARGCSASSSASARRRSSASRSSPSACCAAASDVRRKRARSRRPSFLKLRSDESDQGCDNYAAELKHQPLQRVEAGVDSVETLVNASEPLVDMSEAGVHLTPHRRELSLRFLSLRTQIRIDPVEAVVHTPSQFVDLPVEVVQPRVGPTLFHRVHDCTLKASGARVARRMKNLCNASTTNSGRNSAGGNLSLIAGRSAPRVGASDLLGTGGESAALVP